MEALLATFLAAALAELGDKTQWLALGLALYFRRTAPVLAGIALAAIANAALSAFAGAVIAPMLTRWAATLLLALALGFAGVACFMRSPVPLAANWRMGAFVSSFLAFLLAEFGDKTQFLTVAIAARTGMPALAGAGAAAGVIAMAAVAVIGGQAARERIPFTALRRAAGALFLILCFFAAISALRLI